MTRNKCAVYGLDWIWIYEQSRSWVQFRTTRNFNRDDCLWLHGDRNYRTLNGIVLSNFAIYHSHLICQMYIFGPLENDRKYGNWLKRQGSLTAFETPRASYAVWKTFLGIDRNASAPITMAERWQRTLSEICLGRTAYRMSSRPHKYIYFMGHDGASASGRTRRRWRRSFISILY